METNFKEAISFLSEYLQSALVRVPENISNVAEEIRLRAFKPVVLNLKDKSVFVNKRGEIVFGNNFTLSSILIPSRNDLEISFKKMCNYSVYSYQKEINNGYITLKGGHRVGICGTAIYGSNSSISNIKDISSMNIRVNHKINELDSKILKVIDSDFSGIILVGAPGSGKTTVLRNIAKELSEQIDLFKNTLKKVSVIDERNEFSGSCLGISQNDLGYADILVGYTKQDGIIQAIRSLAPNIIICDELLDEKDVEAIKFGVNSGVKFIVSVHASTAEELFKRNLTREILKLSAFNKIIILSNNIPGKVTRVINIP